MSTVGLAGALAYTLQLRLGDDTGGEPGRMGRDDEYTVTAGEEEQA